MKELKLKDSLSDKKKDKIKVFKKYSLNYILGSIGNILYRYFPKVFNLLKPYFPNKNKVDYLKKYTELYDVEFGFELANIIPQINYLYKTGQISETFGLVGTAPLYFFSKTHNEVAGQRSDINHNLDFHTEWKNYKTWLPPDYKSEYKKNIFVYAKPLLIIYNKYTSEWDGPPINYIDVQTLNEILPSLINIYQIIYIRPQASSLKYGYSNDRQEFLDLDDHDFLKKNFPEVIIFDDLLEKYPEYNFNQLQLMVLANSEYFISVQGGGSRLCSFFGGTNIIYHKKGRELETKQYKYFFPRFSKAKIIACINKEDLVNAVHKKYCNHDINKNKNKLRVYTVYSDSHRTLFENYFLPSLKNTNLELVYEKSDRKGSGFYMSKNYLEGILEKIDCIIQAIKDNWGGVFLFSDVDIIFIKDVSIDLISRLKSKDILFQRELYAGGLVNTGFFVCRGNEGTLKLWQMCRDRVSRSVSLGSDIQINSTLGSDSNINNLLVEYPNLVRFDTLPLDKYYSPREHVDLKKIPLIPKNIYIYHANFLLGVNNKEHLLSKVRQIIKDGKVISRIEYYYRYLYPACYLRSKLYLISLVGSAGVILRSKYPRIYNLLKPYFPDIE